MKILLNGVMCAERGENNFLSPVHGGCWFSYLTTPRMVFDSEFDTYVDLFALQLAVNYAKLQGEGYMCESLIMEYLLKDTELLEIVRWSELPLHQYVYTTDESTDVMTKAQVDVLLAAGKLNNYVLTVSDEFIQNALNAAASESKQQVERSESYTGPNIGKLVWFDNIQEILAHEVKLNA